MTIALFGGACVFLILIQLASLAIAAARLRPRHRLPRPPETAPAVSIVRPVCGVEAHIEETLASGFTLDFPSYELIFCVADERDPVVPVVRRLIAAHPQIQARLLVGEERISDNPKLNNCIKGWDEARHEWLILADSNVLMPADYIQQMLAGWRVDTGLVCSTPLGSRPDGFMAEVECAFLNTLQARWQYVGESLGLGFAQGKSMLWRRPFLDERGGIRALAAEIAEDAAATKLVRNAGRHVHLVDSPFEQLLGQRRAGEVWRRQLRWARLRRFTFPLFFAPEIFTSGLVPIAFGGYAAAAAGYSVIGPVLVIALVWYGAEAALAAMKGWHVTWRFPAACLVRDCLALPLWVAAWASGNVVWRGNIVPIRAQSYADRPSYASADGSQ